MSATVPVDEQGLSPFRAAIETKDVSLLERTLAADVRFRSPIAFSPYEGRAAVGALLRVVGEVLGPEFAYDWQVREDDREALVFTTRVAGRDVEGVDLLRYDADGLVAELVVMMRPASGLTAVREAIAGKLAELSGPAAPDTKATDDTGSWFPVPDASELPPDLHRLFAKAQERIGFVPNVFRVYAFRPERLSAWFSHYRQLHEPTDGLSAADREMIAVVVSAANGCLYCLVAHGAALREELGDPVLGERVSYDWRRAGLDPRRTAICAYAEKLTLHPREITAADLQSLRDAGLTLEEAWDVAEITAMYNLTNRMAMATNMLPNEEYSGEARPRPAG